MSLLGVTSKSLCGLSIRKGWGGRTRGASNRLWVNRQRSKVKDLTRGGGMLLDLCMRLDRWTDRQVDKQTGGQTDGQVGRATDMV